MRGGLLTIGVILLVLGAIFYFLPSTEEDTLRDSVDTTTYQTLNESNDTLYADETTYATMNTTNTTSTTTSTRTNTTRNQSMAGANAQDRDGNGIPEVYLVMTDDNSFRPATDSEVNQIMDAFESGTQAVSERNQNRDIEDAEPLGEQTSNQTDEEIAQGPIIYNDSPANNTNESGFVADMFGEEENPGAATAATSTSGWVRTLSLLAMIAGAILIILGLLLPSREESESRARTSSSPSKVTRYEEEETVIRKRR